MNKTIIKSTLFLSSLIFISACGPSKGDSGNSSEVKCSSLSPLEAPAKKVSIDEIINGQPGVYRLVRVDMLTERVDKQKNTSSRAIVTTRIPADTNLFSPEVDTKVTCKDMTHASDTEAVFSFSSDIAFSKMNGQYHGDLNVQATIYKDAIQTKDIIETKYISVSGSRKPNRKNDLKSDEFQLLELSNGQFVPSIKITQENSKERISVTVRYIYQLVR